MVLGGTPSSTSFMAFETSSSTSPTATASAEATTVSSSSGFLSPGGSPPLILAFLAIGLFSGAMIAVFGWRRLSFGRQWNQQGVNTIGGVRVGQDFGEKPQLWDLWTQRPMSHEVGKRSWSNIMPFSATTISDVDSAIRDVTPVPNGNATISRLNIFFRSAGHSRLGQHFQRPNAVERKLSMNKLHDSRLQVAVAIAMPFPRSRIPHSLSKDNIACMLDGGDRRLEYSIGLVQFPWQREEG